MTARPSPPDVPSAWAPLAFRLYRLMWLTVLASNIGTWMQTVGAQWLLVDLPNAATLVALVQTADTLPDLLLALPGGALADIFDRRRFLIGLQVFQVVVGGALAALTLAGDMTPPLLLAFTFALGAAGALATPAYQALIPEIVPRNQLIAAAALGSVNVNLARAIGPTIAGLLISWIGAGAVFALNAASFVLLPLVLLGWRRPVEETAQSAEHFLPALRAGSRYVRHSPITRRILLRLGLFVFPANAIWALLPLVATRQLGMSAGGYGVLLGALGVGAIGGAVLLPRIRSRLTANQMEVLAGIVYAAAMVVLVVARSPVAAFVALLPAGAAWIGVIASSNASIQLFLPAWVRGRGLATFQMVLFGCQAIGALAWGLVAQYTGLVPTFLAAAGMMLAGVATVRIWPLLETHHLNRDLSEHWPEPELAFEPDPEGPVVVITPYTVAAHLEEQFFEAMSAQRLSRLRTGAISWNLYREGETAHRFVEIFTVATWDEHFRQHHGRLTGADAIIDAKVRALSDPPPKSTHVFPVEELPESTPAAEGGA